jgi:hypothetical protein
MIKQLLFTKVLSFGWSGREGYSLYLAHYIAVGFGKTEGRSSQLSIINQYLF